MKDTESNICQIAAIKDGRREIIFQHKIVRADFVYRVMITALGAGVIRDSDAK